MIHGVLNQSVDEHFTVADGGKFTCYVKGDD